ncbi:MAG TPA: FadR/GntR family transcriptional regulator [Gaiellaceae bacterium]|jgi:DNA-binding FadR family transcriptional regulator|nr:FadR/GntR family transcriptional regulator [Gaiellaceae bacterium]HWJ45823.1 FadR/GntR family transcriptional regulator [Gaiellaceae bacterium]
MARSSPAPENSSLFEPVTPARASSAIAEQIRNAIVSGRLGAGDRLPPERELAEQFGVSRVTVRDALRALEATGLIKVRVGARGGAFVTAPTGSHLGQTMSDMMMMQAVSPEDVVEARLVVELGTVTLACARATAEDLAALRALIEQSQVELKAGTYVREMSWDFHSLVARAAHNGAVEGITASFRSTLSMHPIRTREGTQSHARTVEEHTRILAAIEKRDGETARREMAHHLMRGTNLEKRESALLALWQAANPGQRSRRRAK